VRLNVVASGPSDGPPVVFLHGVSGSVETYGWLPPEIVDGRRIVRIDLRGHGGSERAPGTYRVSEYGADVVDFLRSELGRPVVLVGHSLGGVVAWWIAQNHPDLVVAAFLEDPPLYMGEVAEHERNGAIPIFGTLIEAAARWHADGLSEEDVAGQIAASPMGPDSTDDSHRSRAHALLAMDPGVLEQAYDRSTLAETDTLSPVSVPVFLLAADDAMGAFPERHAGRLGRTHPAVEVVRLDGAPHAIHDSRVFRDAYVDHLTRFLAVHADGTG
jgi:pimeloyl-ACP methyl ester carboxylesterase